MDQGEVPFLAVPKVQNSHPDSGIEPSAKFQGWGILLAIRLVGKFVWGQKPPSNLVGWKMGLA